MKKMILSTLFMATAVFSSAFAFGKTYGRNYALYGTVDSMGTNPMVGVGARIHKGVHAGDFSASICPVSPPESLEVFHAKGLYLFYPNENDFYIGVGLGVLNEDETSGEIRPSMEGSIGYEWKNGLFLQANVTAPFQLSSVSTPLPGVSLGYAF